MSSTYDPNYTPININFRVGQKVVVFNKSEEVLFLRRSEKVTRAGGWDFIGGGLEDESPEEGIKREAREETGIDIINIQPILLITHDRKEANSKILMVGYVADLGIDAQVTLSWEHDQFKWLSVEDALTVELPDDHKKFLHAAIQFKQNK